MGRSTQAVERVETANAGTVQTMCDTARSPATLRSAPVRMGMGMGTVSHRGTARQVISQVGGAHDNRPAYAPCPRMRASK